jgi:hypothetical protein
MPQEGIAVSEGIFRCSDQDEHPLTNHPAMLRHFRACFAQPRWPQGNTRPPWWEGYLPNRNEFLIRRNVWRPVITQISNASAMPPATHPPVTVDKNPLNPTADGSHTGPCRVCVTGKRHRWDKFPQRTFFGQQDQQGREIPD